MVQASWEKLHHLGTGDKHITDVPPDQKSKQSCGANLSLYKHLDKSNEYLQVRKSNIRQVRKRLSNDKHSSLFVRIVSEE